MRTRLTAGSPGVSTFMYNQNNSRSSRALQASQPISVTNPLSVLKKLPDPTTRNEENSSEGRKIDTSSST
jgi:hypothetical protein